MVMTYSTLVASKASPGSIMSWVNYSKLDIETVLAEAESLLAQTLRVREMRTEWVFGMAIGQCQIALPARFLDPIGKLRDLTNGIDYGHGIEGRIETYRSYDTSPYGAFGNNPFITTSGSDLVTVNMVAHDLTQASIVVIAGATAVGGLDLNGTWIVENVLTSGAYTFRAASAATSGATGGGAAATWTATKLISGSPSMFAYWDEKVQFDCAFDAATAFKQLCYKAPLALSATNESNFLTNRYPLLVRKACQTAAADFMKNMNEYNKNLQALNALIQTTNIESDLAYRGMDFGTDIP